MTMLTHTGGRDTTRTDTPSTYSAVLKRFCTGALTALVLGGALGGIVALKTAVYFSRMNY